MAKTVRQDDEPTRSRRVRNAFVPIGRAAAATTACILWGGLALPGLQLLPGSGGFADQSISISLQSAMLGIDDGLRGSTPELRAAMQALGLAVTRQSAPPRLRSASGSGASLAVQVSESVRTDTPAPTSAGAGTEGREDVVPNQTAPAPAHLPRDPAGPADPDEPSPKPGNGGGGGAGGAPQAPPPAPPKLGQSITFTTAPASAVVGGSYSVGASASSGLPVSFSDAPASAGVCTVSGPTVAFVGTGTCTIRANQAGNESYLPATQVTQSFAVAAAVVAQTISFTSTPPAGAFVGHAPYHVTAKATSGLPVEFHVDSAQVCNVTGANVTFVGVGTCTINATQRGDSSFHPAPEVHQSFSVGSEAPKSLQSISFTSSPPSGATAGGTPYTVSAAASSGLPVAFSAAPSSSGVCTVAGATVSFVGSGTCVVRADQAGSAEYEPVPQVSQSFAVGLGSQTIGFTSSPPSGAMVGGAAYSVTANASSGLPVAFSAGAGSSGVCTVSGSTVTFVSAGMCTIDADQAGDASYSAAPQVQQTFSIAKGSQTITFPDPGNYDKTDPPFALSATASSGLAVTYTLDPSSTPFCSLSGNVVTPIDRGDCIVYANQPGDAGYSAAPQVTMLIRIKNHTPGGGG
jgi:hypothetical protein